METDHIRKQAACAVFLALIMTAALYLFRSSSPPGHGRGGLRQSVAESFLVKSRFIVKRDLKENLGVLREFRYRLQSRIESRYSYRQFEAGDFENLAKTLSDLSASLQDLRAHEYPQEYLSQIDAAEESRKAAVMENLKMKSFMALPPEKRKGGYYRLEKLEEAVSILIVHLNGLLANG